jgi:hypothetical protein
MEESERSKIKNITVMPGKKLSLQLPPYTKKFYKAKNFELILSLDKIKEIVNTGGK